MTSSSSHPVINIESNYNYLVNTLKLQTSEIVFEHFLASNSFPISYHIVGFRDSVVIFTYKGEENYDQIKKYVSLVSKMENIDELVESVKCSIGFVEGDKKDSLLEKIRELYSS